MSKSRLHGWLWAVVIGIGIPGFRALSELAVCFHVKDAQGGIAFFITCFWFVIVALVTTAVAEQVFVERYKMPWRLVWASFLTLAIAYSAFHGFQFIGIHRALTQASNPATSTERLSNIFRSNALYYQYELDMALAANPNTPQDILAELKQRNDQRVNECLRRNPNAPPN